MANCNSPVARASVPRERVARVDAQNPPRALDVATAPRSRAWPPRAHTTGVRAPRSDPARCPPGNNDRHVMGAIAGRRVARLGLGSRRPPGRVGSTSTYSGIRRPNERHISLETQSPERTGRAMGRAFSPGLPGSRPPRRTTDSPGAWTGSCASDDTRSLATIRFYQSKLPRCRGSNTRPADPIAAPPAAMRARAAVRSSCASKTP